MTTQPVIIENVFSPEEIEKILHYCKKVEKQSNPHSYIAGAFGVRTSLEADRISHGDPIVPLTGDPEDDESIWAISEAFLRLKSKVEEFFGQEMSFTNRMYSGMPAGTRNPMHYDNHSLYDKTPNNDDEESEWSGLVYLNTCGVDYTGGEIVFPDQDLTISPKAGMIVFFEGSLEFPHEVVEVTSGYRRGLICFFSKKGNVSDRALFLHANAGVDPNHGANGTDPHAQGNQGVDGRN